MALRWQEFFINRAALKMAAMDAALGLRLSGADAAAQEGDGGLMRFSEESLAASVAAFQATMAGASTSSIPRPAPSLLYFGDVAAGPGGFSECAPLSITDCHRLPLMTWGRLRVRAQVHALASRRCGQRLWLHSA